MKTKCDFCDHTSSHKQNLANHIKNCEREKSAKKSKATMYRELKKLKKELNIKDPVIEQKQFNEDDLKKMIDDHKGSLKDLNNMIKYMRLKFGRSAFVPNIRDLISKHVNSLNVM